MYNIQTIYIHANTQSSNIHLIVPDRTKINPPHNNIDAHTQKELTKNIQTFLVFPCLPRFVFVVESFAFLCSSLVRCLVICVHMAVCACQSIFEQSNNNNNNSKEGKKIMLKQIYYKTQRDADDLRNLKEPYHLLRI